MQALFQMPSEMANPGWVLVAVAAGLLGVAVLVLARIRRFQTRPLRICFFLSIMAHALLLAVFYLSRALDMPYVPGGQLTFIVALSLDEVDGLAESTSLTSAPPFPSASPLPLLSEPAATVADLTEPQPDATATPVPPLDSAADENPDERIDSASDDAMQAPPLLEPPPPEPAPARDETPAAEPVVRLAEDLLVPEAESTAQQDSGMAAGEPMATPAADAPPADERPRDTGTESTQVAAQELMSEPVAEKPPVAAWSSTRKHATAPRRLSLVPRRYRDRVKRPADGDLKRRGGSPFSEQAVESALRWLARNQSADGRWDPRLHEAGAGGWIEGQQRGSVGLQADTGITGLALLTFLASGHTHKSGDYRQTVQNGLDYLISQQSAQGNLGGDASIYAQLYCHGIASLALCEALALSGDDSLKPTAERAIDYTVRSQHRGTGGWRYRPGDLGDMSQFGWQLMAIVSAREAGLDSPENVDLLMKRFLESVQCGTSRGLAAYQPGHRPSHAMTAEALACRGFLGLRDDRQDHEAIQYLMTMKPGVGPRNFYYWYYATIALSQLEADEWTDWNHALQSELLTTQRRVGPMAGSWDPTTVWGKVGGRVYTTAMATLCLESYYRFAK